MLTPWEKIKGYTAPLHTYYATTGWGACWMSANEKNGEKHVFKVFEWKAVEDANTELEAAKIFKQINHLNLVKVVDIKQDHELGMYYIMEYWGDSLREKIKSVPPHPFWSIDIVKQVLLGLQELHKRKLVHRDIKPDNIFIKDTEKGMVAKLGDYGLVKSQRWATQLSTGGTLFYMAPEMMPNADEELKKQRDHRCDIYSVGAVLYELLILQPPLIGPVSEKPPKGGFVSNDLWQIIRKALEQDPDKRYQSAEDFIKSLDKVSQYLSVSYIDFDTYKYPVKESIVLPASSEQEYKMDEETEGFSGIVWTPELNRLYRAKKYDDVITEIKKQLSHAEKTLGVNSPKLVPIINSLAYVYSMQSVVPLSEKFYSRSLEILRIAFGKESPQIIQTLNALAWTYYRNKCFEQAESKYKEALFITEKNYNPESIQSVKQRTKLGDIYYGKKDFIQSESYYQEALDIKKKILGENNMGVCVSLRQLAYLYKAKEDYQKSEFYFKQALKILDVNRMEKTHPEYKYAWEGLKFIYKKIGNTEKTKQAEAILNLLL
ncbi:MAG: serine/threonine-protein kinase [Planctomycetota bacterium]